MSELTCRAFVVGTGNSITQIIHVGAGSQRQELKLSLNFDSIRAGCDHGLPRLLKWNGRISPLLGRGDTLAQLREWLADPNGKPVQIISGPGGVGKTRLAAEFALELRGVAPAATKSWWKKFNLWPKKSQPQQWKTGFVTLDDLGEVPSLHSDEPALCIFDYPEERLEFLCCWIDAFADEADGKCNLRVLFVTRDAETVVHAFRDRHREHLLPDQAIKLASVAADDGYRVLGGTLDNLANLGYPAITVAEGDFAAWRKRSLLHESPLFVVALAIHLTGGDVGSTTLQLDGTRLLDALCEREETRLQNIGKAHGVTAKNAAADVLAWAILLDRLEPTERDVLCEALLPAQAEVVLTTLQASGALNENAPELAHMEPDFLAAWWLHRWKRRLDLRGVWDAHSATMAKQMAKRTGHIWDVCVPHWNRLGYDLASRLGQAPNSIDQWAAKHIATTWQPYAAEVRAAFVRQTNWHGMPDAAVAASAVTPLFFSGDAGENELATYATQLSEHAVALDAAGQRSAALSNGQEAVTVYRHLVQGNPDAYEPDLAVSLNNLAGYFSKSGQLDSALGTAQEAVEIRRSLALFDPAAFEPDLVGSLSNLANCLSQSGQCDAGLATALDAVAICRRLTHGNLAAYESILAICLNNLASRLSESGQRDAALNIAQEALAICRHMAHGNPAAFEPDLAESLNKLAKFLSESGQRDAALATGREAVEIFRRLAQSNSAAFEPVLATSLSNLASFLSESGQHDAALSAVEEAVAIRRSKAHGNPVAFEPDLAVSLINFASFLSKSGQREASLNAAQEAVDILCRLEQDHPAVYGPNLAMSLNNLANSLSDTGKHDAALAAAQKAVVVYRRLAQGNSAVYESDLARGLASLAMASQRGGDLVAARAAVTEALDIIEPWAELMPAAFAGLRDSIRDDCRRY